MELYIGGLAQGKRDYVLNTKGIEESRVRDELHLWFKELLLLEKSAGERPEDVIKAYVKENPDCVLICNEVGNGIVPMDPLEREYRERLGRLLIELAKEATHVERIIMGIGQTLK